MHIKNYIYILIIRNLVLFILIISFGHVSAQLINADQAPPSVKWKQIQSVDFNLIYPIELQSEAQRVANILKTNIDRLSEDIGIKPRKINIILQNRNIEGNGYVQLAPRKSEFYTTSPQDDDPTDWVKTLAIHEYRHVVQIDKLTGNIQFPFEELGFAFFGITLPTWFYEGDAVTTETLFSKGGRGRIPSFEMNLRANLLEGKSFSYQKNYLGSLRDVTPGYYNLGYFMATKMRLDYGDEILDSLLSRISKNPLRPYNFSRSLKKLTGYTSKEWHDHTLSELTNIWKKQRLELNPVKYTKIIENRTKFPLSYSHLQVTEEGEMLAIRETPLSVNSIVKIDGDGNSEELIKTGRQATSHFSYANKVLAWDEIRSDFRFKLRSFSIISTYNISTKKYKQLTKKSRFFSPAVSPDGTKIAVVEVSLKNENSLVILDTETGQETLRIPSPQNKTLSSISYGENEKILAVTRAEEGTGITEFSLQDKSSIVLLENQNQEIESPSYADGKILFKAHYNGIDNLYLLDPESQSIFQISNIEYGASHPVYDTSTNQVYFTNYDGRNNLPTRFTLKKNEPTSSSNIKNTFTAYFKPLQSQETDNVKDTTISSEIFPEKPYKEIAHLFNFHSLSINDGNYNDLASYEPGLFLLSNNLMNTLATKIGFTYDPDQHGLDFQTEIKYNRYFPKFSIGYDNRALLSTIRHPKDSLLRAVRWRENYTQFQVEFPVSFNRLNHNYSLNFRVASSYTQRYNLNDPAFQNVLIRYVEFPMSYQLSIGRNSRYSHLDLAPRWGQNISVGLRNLPFSSLNGLRTHLQSVFYFPGMASNHSTQVRFNIQHREGLFAFDNVIPMVSGYDQLRLTQPKNTFFLNYKFPLAYPDFEIGPLVYIKRLKANLFSDFEDVGINDSFKPRTFGIELRADMNLLRFLLPEFDAGVKAIYINENNPKKFIFQYSMSYSY